MIYKSYLVEENLNIVKNNVVLFYGENLGLINEFKNKIFQKNEKNEIIKLTQEDILVDKNLLIREINNSSLFNNVKTFIIINVNDKITETIQEILPSIDTNKIYLFADVLEKKRSLRKLFEEDKNLGTIPCYQDNKISLTKLINKNLMDFKGLTTEIINLLIENCDYNRAKLENEITKINNYFSNKTLNIIHLEKLLNLEESEVFNNLRDSAMCGEKNKTNKLLNSITVESDKSIFYINIINSRLLRLKEMKDLNKNIEMLRPPIFWKDKPKFLIQSKLWCQKKINKGLIITYNLELNIKSNSNLKKNILVKKLLVDICNLANAA